KSGFTSMRGEMGGFLWPFCEICRILIPAIHTQDGMRQRRKAHVEPRCPQRSSGSCRRAGRKTPPAWARGALLSRLSDDGGRADDAVRAFAAGGASAGGNREMDALTEEIS